MPQYDVYERLSPGVATIKGKKKDYSPRTTVPIGEVVTFEADDPMAKHFLKNGAIAKVGSKPKLTQAQVKKTQIQNLRDIAEKKAKEAR